MKARFEEISMSCIVSFWPNIFFRQQYITWNGAIPARGRWNHLHSNWLQQAGMMNLHQHSSGRCAQCKHWQLTQGAMSPLQLFPTKANSTHAGSIPPDLAAIAATYAISQVDFGWSFCQHDCLHDSSAAVLLLSSKWHQYSIRRLCSTSEPLLKFVFDKRGKPPALGAFS